MSVLAEAPAVNTEVRGRIQAARTANALGWRNRDPSRRLMRQLAAEVDTALAALWAQCHCPGVHLLAVGGYGRGELAPYSDIDLLLLLDDGVAAESIEPTVAAFLSACWDAGLEVGHSIRTLKECIDLAHQDLTVATALLEARPIEHAGVDKSQAQQLQQELLAAWHQQIPIADFVRGKLQERRQRHLRYQETTDALEPNIKESPGGLRDLQVVQWIALAQKLPADWAGLAREGLMTPEEARQLERQQGILHTLRAQLHLAARRREDRLVFDLQHAVATQLDIQATGSKRASELMMQRYYRAARTVATLSAMLIEALELRLEPSAATATGRPLGSGFFEVRGRLDIDNDQIFQQQPALILQAFRLVGEACSHRAMTARTMRALWGARHLIDQKFREDRRNQAAFIDLFKMPRGIVHSLRLMSQLGILGRMLPVFRRIVGQMQHDLFHIYTVDQHILQVIRNLRRLTMLEHSDEFPELSALMSEHGRPDLLYLAALFHDIAKGRGGDHSELGGAEVRRFGQQFQLPAADVELIEFLVEGHLTMSSTAQKHDITDPEVVARFAQWVATPERLRSLYLLTVCDIRGTSPKVWNPWKARLLSDLYRGAMACLNTQGNNPISSAGQNHNTVQAAVESLLLQSGRSPELARDFWRRLDLGYFLQHSAEDLAWHARTIAHRQRPDEPLVSARHSASRGALQVMVYQPDQPALFARITRCFDRLGLSILEARLHETRDGWVLDTFLLTCPTDDETIREQVSLLEGSLQSALGSTDSPLGEVGLGRPSRQSKHFPLEPTVEIEPELKADRYSLHVVAADRPGLLYSMARHMAQAGLAVHAARIGTLGSRVEDSFQISGPGLDSEKSRARLASELAELLRR